MSSREAKSWERYGLINGPYGQERADYHAAQICQAVFFVLEAFTSGDGIQEEQRATLEKCLLKFKIAFPKTPEEIEKENKGRIANELQALIGRFR